MIDIDTYENMTWETPSNELEDAVENLLAEVLRLREAIANIADEMEQVSRQSYGKVPPWEYNGQEVIEDLRKVIK